MLAVTAAADGSGTAFAPAVLTGNNRYQFVWCPTWRPLEVALNKDNSRNSITCYMRGVSEHISIQTNNSTSWKWRRICFTVKGIQTFLTNKTNTDHLFTSQGISRAVIQHYNDDMGNVISELLFDGTRNVDWNDPMIAKTTSTQVSVLYDKTVLINSGQEGVMRDYRRWHGMNKNLVYDDEESGPNDDKGTGYSTLGRQGMGDYYIIDYFVANSTASSLDTLSFNSSAKLYWHEK